MISKVINNRFQAEVPGGDEACYRGPTRCQVCMSCLPEREIKITALAIESLIDR